MLCSQEHANKKGALKAQLEQEVQNGVTAKHTTTASKVTHLDFMFKSRFQNTVLIGMMFDCCSEPI